jgi:tight adherence protein C
METTALLISLATFAAIILLYLALSAFLSSRRDEQNVLKRAAKWSESATSHELLSSQGRDGKRSGIFGLSKFFKKSNKDTTASFYADTPLFYQRAGIYDRASIRSYQVLRVVLFLAPIVVLLLSNFLYQRKLDGVTILATLVIVIVAYYLPVLYLRIIAHYRKKDLYRNFPDAIDLLMVCVEAGMGVDAAIRRVSREIHITSPELAKEFKILSLELKTGKSRNDCLKNLALRTDLTDVDNLVSLMIQAEKYGTGVAHALKIHAEEMRQKRFSRLEQLAAQLPVKMTVPLILFIFPAFFVVIAGPAAIQVLRHIIQR